MQYEAELYDPDTSLDDVLVHILDASNQVVESYAFSRNEPDDEATVRTSQYLYSDDSVHTLKLKISKAIGEANDRTHGQRDGNYPPLETMYVYTRRWVPASELDVEKLYQEITRHGSQDLTSTHMEVFLNNFSIPLSTRSQTTSPAGPVNMDAFLERVQHTMVSDQNPLQGLLQLVPMGFQYGGGGKWSGSDYTFPVNPAFCGGDVLDDWNTRRRKPALMANDYQLLLRYLPFFQNEIYVCLAGNYAPEVVSWYFPRLAEASEATTRRAVAQLETVTPTREYFHQVARKVTMDTAAMPRMQREIMAYTLVIAHQVRIPLEILFKHVSATALVPGIVFNPGKNKENILRLYSTRVSKNGKRIPVLTKRQIVNFVKFSKRQTVVFYLPRGTSAVRLGAEDPTTEDDDVELYVMLDAGGNLHVHGEEVLPETPEVLDRLLRVKLNPLLEHVNAFLQQSGYLIPLFHTVQEPNVGVKHFHARWSFRSPQFFSVIRDLPCIRAFFDIYDEDEEHMVLKYKRPFSDYESQGHLIREFRRMGKSQAQMTEALRLNYGMTPSQCQRRMDEYEVNQEDQRLARGLNREYSFPVELRYEDKRVIVDIFKYCRDCSRLHQREESGEEEYVAGPKGRIYKRRGRREDSWSAAAAAAGLPGMSYMTMVESYLEAILAVLLGRAGDIPVPSWCEKMVFEPLDADVSAPFPDDTEIVTGPELADVIPLAQDEGEEEEEEDQEEAEEGDEEEDEDDEEPEEFLFEGGAKKKYKTKLDRLHERDAELFTLEGDAPYSRACQKKRQPIVMNDEEYQEMRDAHPEMRAISYGTAPNKKYWYSCPQYWCASENRVLTEEQVQRGECRDHVVAANEFVHPGFEDPKKHPKGFCMPCCFKGDTSGKALHVERIKKCQAKEETEEVKGSVLASAKPFKEERVILKYSSNPPVTAHRWMLLPKAVQYFLGVDYTKLIVTTANALKVVPHQPCFLLWGIEHPRHQSFLGLFTELYNYHRPRDPPISVGVLRTLLLESITLDRFVAYQGGALVSVFTVPVSAAQESEPYPTNLSAYANYAHSRIYQTVHAEDPRQVKFFAKTVAAYRNFRAYLKDSQTVIDHTYLWGFMVEPDPSLLPEGCNLVVLELNDTETSIDLLCPPNPSWRFDPQKRAFFVLKRGDYYEPVYQYWDKEGTGPVERVGGFLLDALPPTSVLRRILDTVQATSVAHCGADASQKNLTAAETEALVTQNDYVIQNQVWNLEGKLVGYYVHRQGARPDSGVFLPCLPSTVMLDAEAYPVAYMQSSDESEHRVTEPPNPSPLPSTTPVLWKSYQQTKIRLQDLSSQTQGQLRCLPQFKVWDPIQNAVTGVMTESLQYVPVFPHEPPQEDGLPTKSRSDDVEADQTLALINRGDPVRERFMANVTLETRFYQVFRSLLRQLLNNYENRSAKKRILAAVSAYTKRSEGYSQHLMSIAMVLEQLSQGWVEFFDYSERELLAMAASPIRECLVGGREGRQLYCRGRVLVIPATNLMATDGSEGSEDRSNRNIYFMRLSDELLRFRRIQEFMFQPRTFLNVTTGMSEYVLTPWEILVLESFLTDDYFQDMIPFNVSEYIHQTNYDTSEPFNASGAFVPVVTLDEQQTMQRRPVQGAWPMAECMVQKSDKELLVEGNNRSIWKRSFPKDTREFGFKSDSPACTYAVLAYLLHLDKRPSKTVQEMQQDLWQAYSAYLPDQEEKIRRVLSQQGKKALLATADLQTVVLSDTYFLTDLDLWALATYWNIPLVLFSSGSLKMLATRIAMDSTWLFLTSKYASDEDHDNHALVYNPVWFIRSPLSFNKQTGLPAYSLIESAFSVRDLKEIGTVIQRAADDNADNFMSLGRFLEQITIMRPRARPRLLAT